MHKYLKKLIDVKEAARIFGVSTDTIYKLTKTGVLPHVKIAGLLRFEEIALQRWLRDQNSQAVTVQEPQVKAGLLSPRRSGMSDELLIVATGIRYELQRYFTYPLAAGAASSPTLYILTPGSSPRPR